MANTSKVAFGLDEAFALAEQIERNGAAFYRKAARTVPAGTARIFLDGLAAKELEHEATFKALRETLVDDEERVSAHDSDDTVEGYLKAMADQYVFDRQPTPGAALTGKECLPDILRMAITKEKDSIVLYVGIRQALKNARDRKQLEAILKEEQGHLVDLAETLKELSESR